MPTSEWRVLPSDPSKVQNLRTGEILSTAEYRSRVQLEGGGDPSPAAGSRPAAGDPAGQQIGRGDIVSSLLQVLGQAGSAFSQNSARKAANKTDARSRASANLVNALARRPVARGSRTQPNTGLLGVLSGAAQSAGQAGSALSQLGRQREQQDFTNQQTERRTRATETGALASLARAGPRGTTRQPPELSGADIENLRRLYAQNPNDPLFKSENFRPGDWLQITNEGPPEEPEEPDAFAFDEGVEELLRSAGLREAEGDPESILATLGVEIPPENRPAAIGFIQAGQDTFEPEEPTPDEEATFREREANAETQASINAVNELEALWKDANLTGTAFSLTDLIGFDVEEGGFSRRVAPGSADLADELQVTGLRLAKALQGARASDLDLKTALKALPRQSDSDELATDKFNRLRRAARLKQQMVAQGLDAPAVVNVDRQGRAILADEQEEEPQRPALPPIQLNIGTAQKPN